MQLVIESLQEFVPNGKENRRRIDDESQGENARVPHREASPDRGNRPPSHHGSPSCTTKPTPRTVWIRRTPPSTSTFFRSRAICTSITLSSGVARRGSFHTSRASISRETRWFW